ncbi:exodeoxyribonuclease I [Methylotetracoccus oryzae]|uniref:exodeoxyribonuclease I n=1 Tax=Methylotetracoccus oryzae TaxID=1919059 RepID=UPI00111937E4|nr:exodeoxyribonuclease I [Methylotetracoccus oryzae]
MSTFSFFWYDLETFGLDPVWDRPAQFAGIRTDADFNPLEPPLVLYCRPPADYLPDPAACVVTGISPQLASERGVPEAEFAAAIRAEFLRPQTCVVGYNNLRFDDEVMRQVFYRSLFDPYEREWRNGNSRWDIIDMVRLVRALRPEGLAWPLDGEGHPTFRLELLTAANGIAHSEAHDALADVRATIALAQRIKAAQPRLFDFVFSHRGKAEAAALLQVGRFEPVVHVSSRFGAERQCLAIVVALAMHPTNRNAVIVYDLGVDPSQLLDLDTEAVRERVFTAAAELGEGKSRIPLKLVHLNKAPVLAPITVLRPEDRERLAISRETLAVHLAKLRGAPGLAAKVARVFEGPERAGVVDPDAALYGGGFIGDADRRELDRLHTLPPAAWAGKTPPCVDPRLPEMVFRYRARNYPELLDASERDRWESQRLARLTGKDGTPARNIAGFQTALQSVVSSAPATPQTAALLSDLRAYGEKLLTRNQESFPYT